MFKKKYFIVLFFVSTFSNLNSQPYYYTSTYEPIAGLSKYKGSIYRINISNPTIVDTLIPNVSELVSVSSDEFGNWVSYGDNDLLTILSINNLVHRNVISNNSEGIIKFSYAGAINKLVVLYESDDYPNPRKLVIVNPETLTITDSIPYDIYRRCFTSQDISFSKSGDVMYLLRGDSVLLKPTIISYSLSSKQLIKTKYIEELSYTGSNEFYFDFRRNGLGVIESWFESPNSTSYYRIYFLDHDSLSITIQRDESQTWGNAYIASNGNYLLMFKSVVPDSVNISPLTGEIDIYNMVNGEIKKTIQLPSDGEVMCFENYPNNVYYVKDIELPTRQVWNLDMDSIFNEIDLESLDPDTVDINSPTLALTIKGIGFDSVSTVYFNGQERLTTFVSDSVLIAEILASDLSVAGSYPVWVTDTWGVSDTLQFVVKAPIVIAADINVINPAMSLVNPGAFTMEINGSGFNSSAVVYFNGNARATTFVSDSVLNTQILSTDVSVAGNFPVWVSDNSLNSDTLFYKVVSALPQPVRPVLECVTNNGDGTYTAFFGYKNENSISVYIPVGNKNKFTPNPQDRGQSRVFKPGRQIKVYTVNFNGSNLVWTLNGRTSTASSNSTPCQ